MLLIDLFGCREIRIEGGGGSDDKRGYDGIDVLAHGRVESQLRCGGRTYHEQELGEHGTYSRHGCYHSP